MVESIPAELLEKVRSSTCNSSLSFYNEMIDPEDFKMLCDALSHNNSVKRLVLDGCMLGDQGCAFLSELLKKNNHLKVLDLQMNGISSKGCKTLAEGLKQNSSVVEIYLGNNKLNDSEMEEMRIALPRIDIRCPMPGSTSRHARRPRPSVGDGDDNASNARRVSARVAAESSGGGEGSGGRSYQGSGIPEGGPGGNGSDIRERGHRDGGDGAGIQGGGPGGVGGSGGGETALENEILKAVSEARRGAAITKADESRLIRILLGSGDSDTRARLRLLQVLARTGHCQRGTRSRPQFRRSFASSSPLFLLSSSDRRSLSQLAPIYLFSEPKRYVELALEVLSSAPAAGN